jgi:hypothetical protein
MTFKGNSKNHQAMRKIVHTSKHPGFKAEQGKIEKEGYSKEAAGAILAHASRGASSAAKHANPRLKRV